MALWGSIGTLEAGRTGCQSATWRPCWNIPVSSRLRAFSPAVASLRTSGTPGALEENVRFLVFQYSVPILTKAFYLFISHSGLMLVLPRYSLGRVKPANSVCVCFFFLSFLMSHNDHLV